jgi:hypothetical protein
MNITEDANANANMKNHTEDQDNVNLIMRQTTYTREETLAKLEAHNNDMFKVLREFMRIPEKQPAPTGSLNQTIYKEIRKTLGSVPIDFNANAQK